MTTIDLTQIHRGRITAEIMRRFDAGETGVFLLPSLYRVTIREGEERAAVYRAASEVQAYYASGIK